MKHIMKRIKLTEEQAMAFTAFPSILISLFISNIMIPARIHDSIGFASLLISLIITIASVIVTYYANTKREISVCTGMVCGAIFSFLVTFVSFTVKLSKYLISSGIIVLITILAVVLFVLIQQQNKKQ